MLNTFVERTLKTPVQGRVVDLDVVAVPAPGELLGHVEALGAVRTGEHEVVRQRLEDEPSDQGDWQAALLALDRREARLFQVPGRPEQAGGEVLAEGSDR